MRRVLGVDGRAPRPMGWEKERPGHARGDGWGWFGGAIPDPLGCLPWAISILVGACVVGRALLP